MPGAFLKAARRYFVSLAVRTALSYFRAKLLFRFISKYAPAAAAEAMGNSWTAQDSKHFTAGRFFRWSFDFECSHRVRLGMIPAPKRNGRGAWKEAPRPDQRSLL